MRAILIALVSLLGLGCSRSLNPEDIGKHPTLAFERQVEIRAEEPDALIVLKPYNPTRDQVAASECKAVYGALHNSAFQASIPPEEQRRWTVHGRVGSAKIDTLIGPPVNRDKRSVDTYAYLIRHNYFDGLGDPDKAKSNLTRLGPVVAACDQALSAWGAAKVDEEKIANDVSEQLEWRRRRREASNSQG